MLTLHTELYSSKNSRQIFKNPKTKKFFLAKSSVALKQDEKLLGLLLENKPVWQKMLQGKEYPLYIQFRIYRKTHGVYDYTNIIQGLADCLTKAGYILDDNWKYFIPVFTPHEKDANNPRVEIKIL